MKTCYTIGYGNSPFDDFVARLTAAGIDTVIDVRSSPYSRFNPGFRRENLELSLAGHRIGYRYLGDKIGGRQADPVLLNPDGTVNYTKVRDTEKFREGIDAVLAIIADGKTAALMCAETEPERCHRFALVTPALQARGVAVIHIRPGGSLQPNEELERVMVARFFDTKQARLTGEPVDFVAEMYERVGRDL
jgi:uncharacterized protein (DUF488 family)